MEGQGNLIADDHNNAMLLVLWERDDNDLFKIKHAVATGFDDHHKSKTDADDELDDSEYLCAIPGAPANWFPPMPSNGWTPDSKDFTLPFTACDNPQK